MAFINRIIPITRGELFLDKISAILAEELANQAVLNDNPVLNPKVWTSRYIAFDETEMNAINVSLLTGDFGNKTTRDQDVIYTYAIDIYVKGAGQADSITIKNRIVGLVRGILDNHVYKTLDIPPPCLRSTAIRSINNSELTPDQSSSYITMSQIQYQVSTWEDTVGLDPVALGSMGTVVKLYDSNKGYYWEIQN